MLSNVLLLPLMAAVAVAASTSDGFGETQLFKRGAALDTRDLELAEIHGVNLTAMYKHSVMKRHDGDHYTIWVDNSFVSAEGPEEDPRELEKRQSARLVANAGWVLGSGNPICISHDMRSLTTNISPFSGGIEALARDLAIGGSNSGSNARFFAGGGVGVGEYGGIASGDLSYVARRTHDEYRREYNGRWRAAGEGRMRCTTIIPGQWFPARRTFSWQLIATPQRV
ncbi:hypothetical protein B0I35DRAFT_477303 [Stachybotrys elegans]|uniref:Uncharacterized protein n=1 Tax=Stachybotrys elegans TaxID=80388 RepID=A0A8K0WRT3_9HYPO|nr:hypothetical protein B0I35DRAFT_477303 [Stachybotrys elegans]